VEEKADNALNDTGAAVSGAVNSTGNAIDNAQQALMPTPTGQEFADAAAKSDAFEIEAAKLAATNAQSPEVKEFARMMVAAHSDSTAKIKAAAKTASPAITPNATLTKDQSEDLAELKALKGTEFDKEYIDGQVDAHEDALELMRKYAADGTIASLKQAAGEIAPVVEKHLSSAKALDKD
jgi:putative membrane protein